MNKEEGFNKQLEIYRKMSGKERLKISFELYELAKQLIRQNIISASPKISEKKITEEIRRRFLIGSVNRY